MEDVIRKFVYLKDVKIRISFVKLVLERREMTNLTRKSCRPMCILQLFINACVLHHVPVHSVEVTFLVDTTSYLWCRGNVNNTETYIWTDIAITPTTRLFIVGDGVEKMDEARDNEKYKNFDIMNYYPLASALKMTSISLEDRGTYTCGLLPTSTTIETFVVEVEAEPLFIDISCHSIDDCKSPLSSPSHSNIMCTCKAVGVYPNTLTFISNGNSSEDMLVVPTSSGPDGSFDISADFQVSPGGPKDSFWCTLIGYTGDVNIRRTTATYTFQPPDCELQLVTEDEICTTALLTCVCHNAIPDVNLFTFYDEKKGLIEDPVIFPTKEVELKKELSTFYCRGCNGVNYAWHSSRYARLASHYAECSFKKRIGLIVGLITLVLCAIVIVTVILVIAWRKLKKQPDGNQINRHAPSRNDRNNMAYS